MQRQREEIHINRSGKLKITFVVESKSSNGVVVVVVVGWFFWQGFFSAHLWGWSTLLRPCRPSLQVEVEATACHLHQPPDRFARSAQWPRLPPL